MNPVETNSNLNKRQTDINNVNSKLEVSNKKKKSAEMKHLVNKKEKVCSDEETTSGEVEIEHSEQNVASVNKNGIKDKSLTIENSEDSAKHKISNSCVDSESNDVEISSCTSSRNDVQDIEQDISVTSTKVTNEVPEGEKKNKSNKNKISKTEKNKDLNDLPTCESNQSTVDGETSMNVYISVNEDSSAREKDVGDKNAVSKSNGIKSAVDSPKAEVIVSDNGPVEKTETEKPSITKATEKEPGNDSINSKIADKEAVNEKTVAKDKKHGANTKESKSEGSKKDGESSKKKKSKICEECGAKKGLKFQVLFQGKTRFLCSDTCFKNFKTKQKAGKSATEEAPSIPSSVPAAGDKCGQCQKEFQAGQGYYPVIGEVKPLCSEDCIKKYYEGNEPPRKCSQCKKDIEDLQNLLTWETMDFCNENCLGKYQSYLGSHCTCCQSPVQQSSLGKYCVCFGADIRQFCSGSCLEDFKKGLKVCSFCQTDLSAGIDGFLAPVGDKGQFKDFCSQRCMERYEIMNNISKTAPQSQECFHCKKQGSFKIQVKHEDKSYSLCCDNCVAGFRCSFKIKENMCDTCYKFFKPIADEFSLKLDGLHKHFCTKACMTLFVLSHRKIVPCIWCKVKKYNFDMIEKTDGNGQTQVFCSLNCLSVYRVSLNATSSKSIRCDNCAKNLPAQYHLTMSDGSIRNFCTYQCCIYFQNQFTNVPALTTTSTTRQTSTSAQAAKTTASATSSPVISNVISLASATRSVAPGLVNKLVPQKLVTARQQGPVTVIAPKSQNASSTITSPSTSNAMASTSGTQVVREVVVKPPAPKSVKNKTVSCKPIMQTKGVSCKPHPCHKAVQTDESPKPIFFPIPVPVYVPTPLHMFSRPVPCPVPFPVPIPIPLMVPTSKESPSQVIKHLKDIQEKIPSNPYEAELLMMAEMVAEDGSKTQKEQNLPEETNNNKTNEEKPPTENNIQTSEPVSQEPVCVDVTQEQNVPNAESEVEDEYAFKDNKSHHSKRSAGPHGRKGRKKAKVDEIPVEEVESNAASALNEDQNTTCQNDHPETYARLKHTFGVNAWKQWVLEKNMQMEKGSQSSRKFKLFKTDLLQLPPDELNYSLSLFVKEVRKPSGDRYCSGSIYYLCLGIQQYLFENGRIDNIFTDPYYEKFTECLNEILQKQDLPPCIEGGAATLIEEEILWESKQLGAHSPHVLLNTLMYFNTKYFKLKTVEDHARFSFTHVTKHWKKSTSKGGTRNVLLRYYPPLIKDFSKRHKDENAVYEQVENISNPLRCPVKLYEFYMSKCPECVKVRNDIFYLYPERSCVPDSPVWYSTQPLGQEIIAKMIQRIKIVREINEN